METAHFTHIIKNETVTFTISYNSKLNYIEDINCKLDGILYSSGSVWNMPIKIKSANQLRIMLQSYKPTFALIKDELRCEWYIDILDNQIMLSLFSEPTRADNLDDSFTVDWLAAELEAISLSEKVKGCQQDTSEQKSIPIAKEVLMHSNSGKDAQIETMNATIQHQSAKIAKQQLAIAKYKDQITRQCARIYELKKDIERMTDPYTWK